MKLEVGMYARLHGKIGKITHICMCEQCKLRGFYEPVVDFGHSDGDYISIYWKDDLNASHSIIDLICVGDYVNGYKIVDIKQDYITGRLFLLTEKWETNWQGDRSLVTFYDEDICSVVTKEQIESMQYRIGE